MASLRNLKARLIKIYQTQRWWSHLRTEWFPGPPQPWIAGLAAMAIPFIE